MAHDEILTKRIFVRKTWDAADADRGIARVNRATRARYIISLKAARIFFVCDTSGAGGKGPQKQFQR